MESENDDVGLVKWESVNPEILGLIFMKISHRADEIIRSVSFVCKGWLNVVQGPYCWSKIDLYRWCRHDSYHNSSFRSEFYSTFGVCLVDFVVCNLVTRSDGSCRSLSAFALGSFGFAYVAASGRFLKVLQIPVACEITDDMVKKYARLLVNLKELDISFCLKITHKSLAYFGKSCRSLTNLRRNLIGCSVRDPREDEAYAIANTMPGLYRLELADGRFSDRGLNEILTNCKSLTQLHIEGCEHVSGDLKKRCEHLFVSMTPYDHDTSLDESSESGSSGSDDDDDDDDDDDADVDDGDENDDDGDESDDDDGDDEEC